MGDEANQGDSERAEVKGCKGPHGEYGAIGTITLQRPAWEVYHFLTRVESQPTWNNAVKCADVVKTTKVANDVELKQVQQVMRWGFLALHGDFTLQLSMREDARAMTVHTEMTSQASSKDTSPASSPVSSRSSSFSGSEGSSASGSPRSGGSSPDINALVLDSPGADDSGDSSSGGGRGGFMKRFSSRMTVSELSPSSASLEMQMFMLPSIYVPFPVRPLVGGQVRRQLGGLLQSVKLHVESPDFKPSGGPGSRSKEELQRAGSNGKAERAAFAPAALTLAV